METAEKADKADVAAERERLMDAVRARHDAFRAALAAAPWGRLRGPVLEEALHVLSAHPQWATMSGGMPVTTVIKLHKASDPKQAVVAFKHPMDGTCRIVATGDCFKAMLPQDPAKAKKAPKPKRQPKAVKVVQFTIPGFTRVVPLEAREAADTSSATAAPAAAPTAPAPAATAGKKRKKAEKASKTEGLRAGAGP